MGARERLSAIEEGMSVFDSEGQKLGTIKQVFLGTAEEQADATTEVAEVSVPNTELGRNDPVAYALGEALTGLEALPSAVRRRLVRGGFIEIDRGLLSADAFVSAEHIAGVDDRGVTVTVHGDDVLTAAE